MYDCRVVQDSRCWWNSAFLGGSFLSRSHGGRNSGKNRPPADCSFAIVIHAHSAGSLPMVDDGADPPVSSSLTAQRLPIVSWPADRNLAGVCRGGTHPERVLAEAESLGAAGQNTQAMLPVIRSAGRCGGGDLESGRKQVPVAAGADPAACAAHGRSVRNRGGCCGAIPRVRAHRTPGRPSGIMKL